MRGLTWTDKDGVVHAVIDDLDTRFMPPYALVRACRIDVTWLHGRAENFGHIESGEIRAAARTDTITCLPCIAYVHHA